MTKLFNLLTTSIIQDTSGTYIDYNSVLKILQSNNITKSQIFNLSQTLISIGKQVPSYFLLAIILQSSACPAFRHILNKLYTLNKQTTRIS